MVGTRATDDESLRSGKRLLAVPPRDAEALGEASLMVLEDSALRARLARAGSEAVAPFNWRAIASQHLELYSRLCG